MMKKRHRVCQFLLLMVLFAITATASAQPGTAKEGSLHGSHTTDATTTKEVLKVLDDYLATFNAKNLAAWEGTYQFPHYRLASGNMVVLEKAGLRDSAHVFGPLINAGWSYSKWDHRNIIHASADKVHVDTRFSRYRADGSLLGSYESLYVLTKENGKWGVKLRSSYAE